MTYTFVTLCNPASDKALLKKHKESRHMGIRHFCDKCPKSFTKKTDLNDHIRFKHGNAGLTCQHCSYRCLYKSKMEIHMAEKHPDLIDVASQKKFLCDQCDYVTPVLFKLNMHVKQVHEAGNDPKIKIDQSKYNKYVCAYCDYRTNSSSVLIQHTESKHETKEFVCDQCDYTTRKPAEFSRHWKYRHDPNSKRVPCDKCHFSSTRADALKLHIDSVHEGKGQHCPLCDFVCRTKGELLIHTQGVHEKIRHYCDFCDFSCIYKNYLKKHIKAKHMKAELP